MEWLIGIGCWCLLSVAIGALYSLVRTAEKSRNAVGINGSFEA